MLICWAKMDEFVSKDFPFTLLTKRAAISKKSIVERLVDVSLEGKGFETTLKSLEKAYSAT